MRNNLVLAAAVGYNFKQIELFIKSLRNYFSDKICIIIDANNINLEKKLKEYGCEVITTNINKKKIQFKRYEIFEKYLENKEYNYILLCDCRDIYFQSNPFNFNYKSSINFFQKTLKLKIVHITQTGLLKHTGKKNLMKFQMRQFFVRALYQEKKKKLRNT